MSFKWVLLHPMLCCIGMLQISEYQFHSVSFSEMLLCKMCGCQSASDCSTLFLSTVVPNIFQWVSGCFEKTNERKSEAAAKVKNDGARSFHLMDITSSTFLSTLLSLGYNLNWTACIRHQCTKTTALTCHRCLINNDVEKMNNI